MKKLAIRDQIKMDAAAKEIYQHIFQEITFAKKDQKSIVFCGGDREISSRFLPLYLAAAVAGENTRIVVINGNVQSSSLEADAENLGLTYYLAGHCKLEDMILETDLPHVDVIPVGRASMNPMLLLENEELKNVFSLCEKQYDWVLVNTAPLSENNMSAVNFAQFCDGAVLMAKDRVTNKKWLEAAKKAFDMIGCPVEGCIVTDARKNKSYSKS